MQKDGCYRGPRGTRCLTRVLKGGQGVRRGPRDGGRSPVAGPLGSLRGPRYTTKAWKLNNSWAPGEPFRIAGGSVREGTRRPKECR